MTLKVFWILFFLSIYSFLLIYFGLKVFRKNNSALDLIIDNKNLSGVLFTFIATSASIFGSIFLVFPGVIFRDGFSAAYISFCVILIPLGGILFFKRQWILSKNFGYTSPIEMFNDYFESKCIKYLIIFITLSFSIPFLSLQLSASGKIYNYLSNGFLDYDIMTWILALVLLLSIILGGIKSIGFSSVVQTFLIWIGIVSIGLFTLQLIGGINSLSDNLSILSNLDGTKWNKSPSNNYSALFSTPDIIQLTKGIGKENPVGGIWTIAMIFTFVLTFLGIQSSPAFSMLVFSCKNTKFFAFQQVWVFAFLFGIAIFIFLVIQGMTSNFLGANPLINNVNSNSINLLPNTIGLAGEGNLVLSLINKIGNFAPWAVGALAICGLAALQSTGSILISSGAYIVTRDLFFSYYKKKNNDKNLKLFYRLFALLIVIFSLILISKFSELLYLFGGIAISLGFQMCVPLFSICYFSWFTSKGVSSGLFAGILTVLLTDDIGQYFFFEYLPWGSWPLTIYSGFWGIFANILVTTIVSVFTQSENETFHKKKFHEIFKEENKNLYNKKFFLVIILLFIWIFFSIGPGAIIGNDIFGLPNDKSTWIFKIPSIWAWQIFFWIFGVFILWLMAYKIKMSMEPHNK